MDSDTRQWLAPGIWAEGEAIHIDLELALKAMGYADTVENRIMLTKVAAGAVLAGNPAAKIVEVEE